MSDFRPELSRKNRYWISKHRYYELKHFCLQYPEWKKKYRALDLKIQNGARIHERIQHSDHNDPTATIAMEKMRIAQDIELVEESAFAADRELGIYILDSVTNAKSFARLEAEGIPCGKDMFYDRVRKFYWILSNEK